MGTGGYGFGGGVSVGIPITTEKQNQNFTVSMYSDGQMVWQGILKIQMSMKATPETKAATIQNGVFRMLKNFPPKVKK